MAMVASIVLVLISASPTSAAPALCWPAAGSVSQGFHGGHLALDLAAPSGTPVYASRPGVVTVAGWLNNGGGYSIYVDHGNGLTTRYHHLSAIHVVRGQHVGWQHVIGRVGSTGISTGNHLHYVVTSGGSLVNPLAYLNCPVGWAPPPTKAITTPGDTVGSVAAQFGIDTYAFRAWNWPQMPALVNADASTPLPVGLTVKVAGDANAHVPDVHITRGGQSVAELADLYGTSVAHLRSLNQEHYDRWLEPESEFVPGEHVRIRGDVPILLREDWYREHSEATLHRIKVADAEAETVLLRERRARQIAEMLHDLRVDTGGSI